MLGSGRFGRMAAGLALLALAGAGGRRRWAMAGTAAGGGRWLVADGGGDHKAIDWFSQKYVFNKTLKKTQLKTRFRSVLLTNYVHKKCDFAKQNKSKTKNDNLKTLLYSVSFRKHGHNKMISQTKKQKQKNDNLNRRSVAFNPKYVFTKIIAQHQKDHLKIVRH